MKRIRFIILVILVMVVGYAALSTSLEFYAKFPISYNEDDFQVYFSFVSFLENTESSVEIKNSNHIIFHPILNEDDKKLTVNYEITNASSQYDSEVSVECTSTNQDGIIIDNMLIDNLVEARDITEGKVEVSLSELISSVDEDDTVTCSLNATPIPRDTINNSSISRFIKIDGIKTNEKEWRLVDLVHSTDTDVVYSRSDDNNLYLYSEILDGSYANNIRIYFSTYSSTSAQEYNYVLENGRMYVNTSSGISDYIGPVEYVSSEGYEFSIPLKYLEISSIDDIRTIRLRYSDSSWNKLKEFEVFLSKNEIIVDGNKTHLKEYTEDDIIYKDDSSTVYSRILNDYIYFYSVDESLMGTDLANPSIYVGSKSLNVDKNTRGFMIWYETSLMGCDIDSCSNLIPDASSYSPMRAIGRGVEFKIPLKVLDMNTLDDLKVVRILYRNSSWQEVKRIDISIREKLSNMDLVGKTYVIAKKPKEWDDIFIYLSDNSSWPGEVMSYYVDDLDTYAYIIPDNIESSYVTFSDGKSTNMQYPLAKQNIFKIEKNKSRIWNGELTGVLSWDYVDDSLGNKNSNVVFNLYVPDGKTNNGCVYLYDADGKLDKLYPWPGIKLLNDGTKWSGSFDDVDNYNNVRAIFNNCNSGWQYPSADGIYIKPGIVVTYKDSSIYIDD